MLSLRAPGIAVAAVACCVVAFACGGDDEAPAGGPSSDAGGAGDVRRNDEGGADDRDAGEEDTDAGTDGGADADGGANAPSITIRTEEIDVAAAEDVFVCVYFKTSNAEAITVRSWQSSFTAGVRHVSLLLTDSDLKAPGTVSKTDCPAAPSGGTNSWAYSSWKAEDGWSFPADDGAGHPVGKPIGANQSGYLRLRVTNPTDTALKARAEVKATGYARGTVVTRAEPYVTYRSDISLGPGATGSAVSTCAVPAGSKFNWISSLANGLAVHQYVKDGAAVLFETMSWDNPGAVTATGAPFLAFSADQATVECDYSNTTGANVSDGPRTGDEVCMMLGYHFPATKPRLCFNDTLLP